MRIRGLARLGVAVVAVAAGAVGIAAILAGKIRADGPVGVILSGRNIDMELHQQIVCGGWREDRERAA